MPQKQTSRKAKLSTVRHFKKIRTVRDITEYELSANGLRVLYMHVPGSGTVTSNLVYAVGSRHERRGQTGIAHMLEHMLFKYTHDGSGKKIKTQGFKILDEKGALMNASTWLDRTNYYFTVPTAYMTDALAVEASRMRNLLIEEKEFAPERTNVLSEYEMYAGVPREALTAEIVQAAFVSHGYGHETIGHKPDIEGYTVEMLRDFYDMYYWPNNAVLTMIGDISEREALTAIYTAFAHIPRSPHAIPEVRVKEPVQAGERSVTVTRPSPLNLYACAYKIPSMRDADWTTVQLIAAHLTDGPQSRLEQRLVDTHKASSVDISITPTHDEGLMVVYAQIANGTTHEQVARIVAEEIAALQHIPIEASRLKTLKTKLRADELYHRDGTSAATAELTECIAAGDWTRYYTHIDDIARISQKDVLKVAQTYFIPTRLTSGRFIGTANQG